MSIKKDLKYNIIATTGLVGSMWLVHIIDYLWVFEKINSNGIVPRTFDGLDGILWSPFLHGGWDHLIGNSSAIIPLTFIMFLFYKRSSLWAILIIIITGGLMVWLMARGANHIGASGLIYGQVTFLIASGWFRKNIKSIIVALVIGAVYGGMVWGVLPNQQGVSWEGHLFGAIAGVIAAMFLKNKT